MFNGLRNFVSWLDAILAAGETRVLAEHAYDQVVDDIRKKAECQDAHKIAKEKNSAFLQNLLLTGMPLIVDSLTKVAAPKAPPTRRVSGLEDEQPVTIHRPRPSMGDAHQPAEPMADTDQPRSGLIGSDPSIEDRLSNIERILASRQCVAEEHAAVARRHRVPGGIDGQVIGANEFPAWVRELVDQIKAGKKPAAPPCTPGETPASCEDKNA